MPRDAQGDEPWASFFVPPRLDFIGRDGAGGNSSLQQQQQERMLADMNLKRAIRSVRLTKRMGYITNGERRHRFLRKGTRVNVAVQPTHEDGLCTIKTKDGALVSVTGSEYTAPKMWGDR